MEATSYRGWLFDKTRLYTRPRADLRAGRVAFPNLFHVLRKQIELQIYWLLAGALFLLVACGTQTNQDTNPIIVFAFVPFWIHDDLLQFCV